MYLYLIILWYYVKFYKGILFIHSVPNHQNSKNCKNAESKNIHFQHDTGKIKKLNTEGAKVRQRPDRISMRCDSRIR